MSLCVHVRLTAVNTLAARPIKLFSVIYGREQPHCPAGSHTALFMAKIKFSSTVSVLGKYGGGDE